MASLEADCRWQQVFWWQTGLESWGSHRSSSSSQGATLGFGHGSNSSPCICLMARDEHRLFLHKVKHEDPKEVKGT